MLIIKWIPTYISFNFINDIYLFAKFNNINTLNYNLNLFEKILYNENFNKLLENNFNIILSNKIINTSKCKIKLFFTYKKHTTKIIIKGFKLNDNIYFIEYSRIYGCAFLSYLIKNIFNFILFNTSKDIIISSILKFSLWNNITFNTNNNLFLELNDVILDIV